jgi:hypothetical protein
MEEELIELSRQFIARVQLDMGKDLDYGAESLEWADAWIEVYRTRIPIEEFEILAAQIGAYFGQCLIYGYGGEWHIDNASDPHNASLLVRINPKTGVYPFAKALKHLQLGEIESIYKFYETLPAIMGMKK